MTAWCARSRHPVPVVDPQLDPTGRRVAYAGERAVRVVTLESSDDVVLVGPEPNEPEEVAWGLAEFVANEELDRARGFWWAPDGESLLVERYDESGVLVWHISDPAHPELEPIRVRYPQAGTANALVSLAVVPLSGARVDVDWRSDAALDGHVLEYLAHVRWSGPRPILTLLTRDQRRMEFRELDPATGTTTLLRAITDDAWVELLPGTPRRLNDGRLLYSVDVGETRRLDGRGMAGRGPAWDRLALNDRAGTIDDQAEAFTEVARLYPDDVDSTRVAIRGWSFGGYLALLGVLRRPDVFSAAIAGAPTTDERLYDTCYSERYLGNPNTNPEVYEANNVIPLAARLSKPFMIIHGLADDNVYVAHSLRLSSALLAAGKTHEFIPLSGMTHMANSEVVAENLLLLQVDFLRRALKITPTG